MCLRLLLLTTTTPALSNYALFQIALALALTLGSVGPLYALPLTWLLQHDRPTVRACVGGVLAVAGIVVLSLLGKQQQKSQAALHWVFVGLPSSQLKGRTRK